MNILAEIQNLINEFNSNNNENFDVDSIRIEFSKQHKKEKLEQLGRWKRINSNDKKIMDKLKKRLEADEVTSAYQLEDYNIYYYNSNKDKPKYRKAMMVIFGLKQYHKNPPPETIVNKIVSILKNVSNIDVCIDSSFKPNLKNLEKHFTLKQYFDKKIQAFTDTYYINNPNILMIDKVTIYNKTIKNNLDFICWRIEALITIPNIKYLALPLNEFKQVVDLAREGADD